MPTLIISLTPELVSLIDAKVASGMYHSASEVVLAGLSLLQEQDTFQPNRDREIVSETDSVEEEGIRVLSSELYSVEGRGEVETPARNSKPLLGTVIHYIDPFEPATVPDDWDALRGC